MPAGPVASVGRVRRWQPEIMPRRTAVGCCERWEGTQGSGDSGKSSSDSKE